MTPERAEQRDGYGWQGESPWTTTVNHDRRAS
ncbi:MAG: hypothetical protein QG608_1249 [Actinomycetota bacterium]|nr:hypothetical protein [Actinomycetota bacterium]